MICWHCSRAYTVLKYIRIYRPCCTIDRKPGSETSLHRYFSYLHNAEAHILLHMYRPHIHFLYGDHGHLCHHKLLFHLWLNFDTISDVWFPGEFNLKWLQVYLGQESVQHFSEVGSRQNNYRLPGEKRKKESKREMWSATKDSWEPRPGKQCHLLFLLPVLLKCRIHVCFWVLSNITTDSTGRETIYTW